MIVASFRRAVIGLAGLLAAGEVVSRAGLVDPAYVPPPTTVIRALRELAADPEFVRHLVSTALSWVIALVCATLLGVALGLLLGHLPLVWRCVGPLVEVLRPLPSVALVPLVIVVLGAGAQTKISLAVFAATWPILVTTVHALGEIDARLDDTARIFGASRRRRLVWLVLPSVMPFVLTGIRVSAAIALIVLVATEFLVGGTVGLGQAAYLWGASAGRMDLVLAVVLVAAAANCAVDIALESAQRRWMPWAGRDGAV